MKVKEMQEKIRKGHFPLKCMWKKWIWSWFFEAFTPYFVIDGYAYCDSRRCWNATFDFHFYSKHYEFQREEKSFDTAKEAKQYGRKLLDETLLSFCEGGSRYEE